MQPYKNQRDTRTHSCKYLDIRKKRFRPCGGRRFPNRRIFVLDTIFKNHKVCVVFFLMSARTSNLCIMFLFFLETICTGAMRVIQIHMKTEETQRLRIKFVLCCPICALNLKIKRANFLSEIKLSNVQCPFSGSHVQQSLLRHSSAHVHHRRLSQRYRIHPVAIESKQPHQDHCHLLAPSKDNTI